MKSFFYSFFLAFILISSGEAVSQLSLKPSAITEKEAALAIKEALGNGVIKGIGVLNKTDGFFGNEAYKMLMPPDAKKIESTLRSMGMGAQVDKAILQINRGAEDAVGYAKPIFLDAIKEMTLTDALSIVKGPKDAATQYFKKKTTEKLTAAFTPPVKTSLEKTEATKYYGDLVNTYNKLPTTFKKANPDLTGYVVGKSVEALFDQVAKEEAAIRANPAARSSELLQKVFGGIVK
jgi:hypothetical protein